MKPRLMVTKLGAAALLLVGLPAAAYAQFGTAPVRIEGGDTDCGDWLGARQLNRDIALEHFVLGLLNGFTLGVDKEFWQADGRAISREAAYFRIDGYCRAHPTDFLINAVLSLFAERTGTRGNAFRRQ